MNDAVAQGAKLLVGNERHGALYSPTVIDHVKPEMNVVRTETFGPVSPVIRFRDIDEAIRISNGTAYGLSSAVCTNRLDYITRFVSRAPRRHGQHPRGAGLPPGADAVRRHQGFGTRLQGRRAGGDEELHQHQDVFAALVEPPRPSPLRGVQSVAEGPLTDADTPQPARRRRAAGLGHAHRAHGHPAPVRRRPAARAAQEHQPALHRIPRRPRRHRAHPEQHRHRAHRRLVRRPGAHQHRARRSRSCWAPTSARRS